MQTSGYADADRIRIKNNMSPPPNRPTPVVGDIKNIVEKRRNCSSGAISPLGHNIFNISLTSRVQLHIYLLNVVVLNSANLICRGTDISKYFRASL